MVKTVHQKKTTIQLTRINKFVTLVTDHTYTQENTMNDMTKQFEQFADMMKQFAPAAPQVKPSKNGYEIRTKILEHAKDVVWQDYYAKWGQFETSVRKEHDEVVTKIEMPTVPGADTVLETAQKFYDFVNNNK